MAEPPVVKTERPGSRCVLRAGRGDPCQKGVVAGASLQSSLPLVQMQGKTNGDMADFADALALELQICYHRDAYLSYLELKTMVDELVEEKKKFQDEKLEYQDMINTFVEEKQNLKNAYQVMKEKVAPMEEQLDTVKKELAAAIEQLAQKNEELEVLRKKLWESEAMHTQLQKQKDSAPGPVDLHFRRVTRSMQKRETLLQSSRDKTSTRTMYADSRWI